MENLQHPNPNYWDEQTLKLIHEADIPQEYKIPMEVLRKGSEKQKGYISLAFSGQSGFSKITALKIIMTLKNYK